MLYDAYLRFPRAFYDRHATGEVISRATNDIYPVRYFIGWGVVQAMQSVMMLVGAAVVLLVVNARLALFAAIAMPPVAVLTYASHSACSRSRARCRQRKGDLTEASDEAVVGIEMVQAFGREDDVRDRFGGARRRCAPRRCARRGVEARFLPGLIFLPSLAIAAVLFFGGREAIAGELTIGQFTLFVTLLLQLVWPLEALGWIMNLAPAGDRLGLTELRLAREHRAAAGAGRPTPLPSGPLDVAFEGVHFAYATEARSCPT